MKNKQLNPSEFFTNTLSSLISTLPPKISSQTYEISQYNYQAKLSDLQHLLSPSLLYHYSYILQVLERVPHQRYQHLLLSTFLLVHNEYIYGDPQNKVLEQLNTNLFEITSLIQGTLSNNEHLISSTTIGISIITIIEVLFEIIATALEKFNPNMININVNNEKQIENDIKILYFINRSLSWLNPLVIAIDFTHSLIRNKNFIQTHYNCEEALYKAIGTKAIILNLSIFIQIDALISKYTSKYEKLRFSHFFTNDEKSQLINMKKIQNTFFTLFNAKCENLLLSYKNCEKSLKCEMNNLLSYSKISSVISFAKNVNNSVLTIKFHSSTFKLDYHSYFIFYYDFNVLFCDKINAFFSGYIDEVFIALKRNESIKERIDLDILDEYITSLKDFAVLHMIASFNNDSLCDCFVKNEWLKYSFLSLSLSIAVKAIICVLKTTNEKEKRIIYVYNELAQMILNNQIVFPIKLFIFKEMLIHNAMIIFDVFAHQFTNELRSLVSNAKINASPLIQCLYEIMHSQNMFSFYIANKILRMICNEETFKGCIRLYTNISFPLDYYDIELYMRNASSNSSLRYIRENAMKIEVDENKENVNIFANTNSNTHTIHKGATINNNAQMQANPINTNNNRKFQISKSIIEYYDISSIIQNFSIDSLKDISDLNIGYTYKNKKHILSYTLPSKHSPPVILVQGKSDIERWSFDGNVYANNCIMSYFSKKINSKGAIENIFQCLLYGEVSGNNKLNLDNTMKYYDTSFKMDYFEFVDKLKEVFV